MRRETDWCETCKKYHDYEPIEGAQEVDSGWRLREWETPAIGAVVRADKKTTPHYNNLQVWERNNLPTVQSE